MSIFFPHWWKENYVDPEGWYCLTSSLITWVMGCAAPCSHQRVTLSWWRSRGCHCCWPWLPLGRPWKAGGTCWNSGQADEEFSHWLLLQGALERRWSRAFRRGQTQEDKSQQPQAAAPLEEKGNSLTVSMEPCSSGCRSGVPVLGGFLSFPLQGLGQQVSFEVCLAWVRRPIRWSPQIVPSLCYPMMDLWDPGFVRSLQMVEVKSQRTATEKE